MNIDILCHPREPHDHNRGVQGERRALCTDRASYELIPDNHQFRSLMHESKNEMCAPVRGTAETSPTEDAAPGMAQADEQWAHA